jgi:spore cortex formation protein SpoVR/YcgB (stage V sporulation)
VKKVPVHAQVSQEEYRRLRADLKRTCEASGYPFIQVWNVAIEAIENRHAAVLAGEAEHEMSLAQSIAATQHEVVADRLRRVREARETAEAAAEEDSGVLGA